MFDLICAMVESRFPHHIKLVQVLDNGDAAPIQNYYFQPSLDQIEYKFQPDNLG